MSKSRAQTVLDEWRAKATQDSDWDGFVDAVIVAIDQDTENSTGPMWANRQDINDDPPFTFCGSKRNDETGNTLPCLILALEDK